MGEALDQYRQRRHVAIGAKHHEVERAVFAVGLEKTVEAEQAGQQRADPQDRRADTRQQVEVRPDAEGHGGDHGQEEDHADERAAAGAHSEPQIADIER